MDHITILFRGILDNPLAARFFQTRNDVTHRDLFQDRVCTATQSSSLRLEIVGFFSAGKIPRIAGRHSLRTLSISPTRPSALMAPSSNR